MPVMNHLEILLMSLKITKILYESLIKTMDLEYLRGNHAQALSCVLLSWLVLILILKI